MSSQARVLIGIQRTSDTSSPRWCVQEVDENIFITWFDLKVCEAENIGHVISIPLRGYG